MCTGSLLINLSYLKADFALERLDAGVDVGMLLQAGGSSEGLPTLGAGVAAGAFVLRADVALQVGRIGKYLQPRQVSEQVKGSSD